MAKRQRVINIYITPGTFSFLFRKSKEGYDLSEITELRQLLSNEKAKLLNVIKTKNPESIYHLAKIAGRDFKSIKKDLSILEKFGLVRFEKQETGNRRRLKPIMTIDKLQINIDFS